MATHRRFTSDAIIRYKTQAFRKVIKSWDAHFRTIDLQWAFLFELTDKVREGLSKHFARLRGERVMKSALEREGMTYLVPVAL